MLRRAWGAWHETDWGFRQLVARGDEGGRQAMISLGSPPVRLRREPPFQNNIVVAAQGFRVAVVVLLFFLIFFVGAHFPKG